MTTQTFADFGVDERIVASLESAGIVSPFPIQSLTLPIALKGQDIIGQAQTGTGKTLGFCIPILHKILNSPRGKAPHALIVVPTRELAVQVADDIAQASSQTDVRTACIYGGRSYEPQVAMIKEGVDIVVGTPGRLIDLQKQRILRLNEVSTMVLDEADRMFDLGFQEDIEILFNAVNPVRHTMLFSATMPGQVMILARKYMTQSTHIRAEHDETNSGAANKNIEQFVYRCHSMDKDEVLGKILQAEGRGKTIIFTQTKRSAAKIVDELTDRGFPARPLHGDLNQEKREKALKAFREGNDDIILVATDVAARGIDVDDVTHVINFQCPDNEDTYVHRIGRTGRAGNTGIAVTFVDWEDMPRWGMISRALKLDESMVEPRETYSSSEHLFSDMRIPAGTKGRLKPAKPVEKRTDRNRNNRNGQGARRNNNRNRSADRFSSARGSRSADSTAPKDSTTRPPREKRERKRKVVRKDS